MPRTKTAVGRTDLGKETETNIRSVGFGLVESINIWVLMFNVGPKSSKKQSDICQKSVRKLSVTKISQKTVRNVSDISQKTVSCKYLSELC